MAGQYIAAPTNSRKAATNNKLECEERETVGTDHDDDQITSFWASLQPTKAVNII